MNFLKFFIILSLFAVVFAANCKNCADGITEGDCKCRLLYRQTLEDANDPDKEIHCCSKGKKLEKGSWGVYATLHWRF